MTMRIIILFFLLLVSAPAIAATKYVRTDGGTPTQCTGLTNAAYDGAGTGEACAYKHISWALGMQAGGTLRIAGGDTLIIANGNYTIGYGAANGDQTGCPSDWSSVCYLNAIPSGTNGNPTRILGANYATGCKSKPRLATRGMADMVLNLTSSDWVELACLEITDNDDCFFNSHPTMRCATAPPYSENGIDGIYASDSDNVKITDVNVHGMGEFGFLTGRLSNWELLRVRIVGNGYGGFSGALPNAQNSSNTGYINFKFVEIAFNGCQEDYPVLTIIGCWGQNDGGGGYGDGIGTEATAGAWLFEDSWVHHNSSDGIDMLYIKNAGGTLTVRRTRAVGNAGQQLKTNGDSVLIESNLIVGNCSYFYGRFGSNMQAGDSCRASGNVISSTINNLTGVVLTIRYNTITGEGDNLILLRNDNNITTNNAIVNIENNVLYGQTEWQNTVLTGHLYYFNVTPTINWRSNSVYNVAGSSCPATSTCTNPNLSNTAITTFDPRPTSASYLRNSGNTTYTTPSQDVNRRARPQETTPTRGGLEYIPLL